MRCGTGLRMHWAATLLLLFAQAPWLIFTSQENRQIEIDRDKDREIKYFMYIYAYDCNMKVSRGHNFSTLTPEVPRWNVMMRLVIRVTPSRRGNRVMNPSNEPQMHSKSNLIWICEPFVSNRPHYFLREPSQLREWRRRWWLWRTCSGQFAFVRILWLDSK